MEFGRLWPVIIIVLGLAILVSAFITPFRFDRIFGGLFWATIGTIFLLNTLDILPFGYWLNLLSFWPVLIIAAGFAVLGGVTHSRIVSALAPVIIIATLIFAVFYQGIPISKRGSATYTFSHNAVSAVKSGTAGLDFGAGDLKVGSTGKLYDITIKEFVFKEKPQFSFDRSGSTVDLSIKPRPGSVGIAASDRNWNVLLSKDVAWRLDCKTGAATCMLDLSDLKVDDLSLKGGVGDISVRLGDRLTGATADINAGVSDIKVQVPRSVGVRLRVNSGISSTDFANIDLSRVSGTVGNTVYETPGFNHAAKKILLYVKMGVSSLKVQGY
jgi:hypothetical protein